MRLCAHRRFKVRYRFAHRSYIQTTEFATFDAADYTALATKRQCNQHFKGATMTRTAAPFITCDSSVRWECFWLFGGIVACGAAPTRAIVEGMSAEEAADPFAILYTTAGEMLATGSSGGTCHQVTELRLGHAAGVLDAYCYPRESNRWLFHKESQIDETILAPVRSALKNVPLSGYVAIGPPSYIVAHDPTCAIDVQTPY